MSLDKSKIKYYIPMIFTVLFSISTLVFFFVVPWDWKLNNNGQLILFMLLVNISFMIGYILACKNTLKKETEIFQRLSLIKLATIILSLYLLYQLLYICTKVNVNIWELPQSIIEAIWKPSVFYYNRSVTQGVIAKIIIWGGVFLSPIAFMIIPVYTYKFNNINKNAKILLLINIFIYILTWILSGQNKGIFDLMVIIMVTILLKKSNSSSSSHSLKLFYKKNKKIILAIFIAIAVFLFYFINNISSRLPDDINHIGETVFVNKDSLLYSFLPKSIINVLLIIGAYMVQGYYGLAKALQLPFTTSYGIGFSSFITNNVQDLFNVSIFQQTYLFKLEEIGWSASSNWHTMYVWFANDISFVGVIILMFFIGFLFAKIWQTFLEYHDSISLCLFIMFIIMFFYSSANNQIFNNAYTCVAFFVYLGIWLWKYFPRNRIKNLIRIRKE